MEATLPSPFPLIFKIDRASADIGSWYAANAVSRPPILGGLSRDGQSNWTIHIHPVGRNRSGTLSQLCAIVAGLYGGFPGEIMRS